MRTRKLRSPTARSAARTRWSAVPRTRFLSSSRRWTADVDGSLRLQLARAYQAAGQAEQARAALKDYEEFRKAAPPGAPEDPATAITAPR